jgi:hypothetical protein
LTAPRHQRTPEDERADVLAWLHLQTDVLAGFHTFHGALGLIQIQLERGMHVGAATRPLPPELRQESLI